MTDRIANTDFDDAASVDRFRDKLAELEKRAAGLSRDARHDVTNALGAARNAMQLIGEGTGADGAQRERFIEIARRNIEQAERMVRAGQTAAPPAASSGRNERDDFRSEGERDDLDARGL